MGTYRFLGANREVNLFLLTYDRRRRKLLSVQEFAPGHYAEANERLFAGELADPTLEIVLLEAPSLDQLRMTHSRYFEDVRAWLTQATA